MPSAMNSKYQAAQKEFNPGENTIIQGTSVKENGEDVNGFIEVGIVIENESDTKMYYETINNGFFSLNISMPKDSRAGQYLVKLNVYEKDPLNQITNRGFADYNILINQIPTSLEIVFESQEVNPGEPVKAKAILHDQTGEKIVSTAILTIKNSKDKIFEQKEIATDEFLEFPIAQSEPPSQWTVVVVSNKITTKSDFRIAEKEDADVEIINKTVVVTNTGNVPYNETLLVKIGNSTVNIDVYLEMGEIKKYALSAVDGEYQIDVVSNGESIASKRVLLTGNSIDVKEDSGAFKGYSLVWIFVILILGFMGFLIYKNGVKKSFFGYVSSLGKSKPKKIVPFEIKKEEVYFEKRGSSKTLRNRAELSLSIQGEKQNSCVICLRIKNADVLSRKDDSTKNTLKEINRIVEENRGFIYENQSVFFFLFVPAVTKTFKNEKKAAEIAEKISNILLEHNKMFRQKLEFGISVDYGEIVSKRDNNVMQFASFGNLMNISKKIATLAQNEVYLSDKIGKRLLSEMKAEKRNIQGTEVYKVKEMRERKDENKKFLSSFVKRMETENKK